MAEINPELFKHILVYHLLYFIVGGILLFRALAYWFEYATADVKYFLGEKSMFADLDEKKRVSRCRFYFFYSVFLMFLLAFVGGIVTTADSMARYLQASNKNLLGVSRIAMHHFIAELDTEAFILLSKEFQEYEKKQRDIKSMETLEYIGKAERREKQRKKEIQKSLERLNEKYKNSKTA